jgi:hypothetical protein
MPSGYLHLRCATLAAGRANVASTEAYLFGAQGPDPLFTLGVFPLRPSSDIKPYGKMLHTARTGRFLLTLCGLAAERGDVEKAFAAGFLTHYALDSTVHPYVNAHSVDKNGDYSSAMHMRLEKNWDALYYSRAGKKGRPDAQPGIPEPGACWEAIAALLSGAITAVYPENSLSAEDVLEAFEGTRKLNRLARSRMAYCLAYLVEKLLKKPLTVHFTPGAPMKGDIENTARAPWRPPAEPDRVRNEGLTELFETAAEKAGELLKASSAFFEGGMSADSLAAAIGNAGYDTGIGSLP